MAHQVSGVIHFDEQAEPVRGAIVRVHVDDVTHADAASRQVGHLEITDYTRDPGDPPLEFTVTTDDVDQTHRYEVRVHLDLEGTGEYASGDQITTQSYPVLTLGQPTTVQVHLHQIT